MAESDPISVEIISNALRSVCDEAFIALMKSAYSTNIKERRDHSTAIMDITGRLIVQAEQSLPVHLASMGGLMQAVLEKYAERIEPGDVFIGNDPYAAGGTHLPDINMALPVFWEGRLVGFVCNIAHHADVGGQAPGSMAGGMSEIYQEGLRIPAVKLFRAGELQQDLLDLLLLNVRVPEERRGDYFAQLAASRLGERRLGEILGHYGANTVLATFQEIVGRTSRRIRAAVAQIPDGVYRFADIMDDDGLGTEDIPIRVEITVRGERIVFDFSGSGAQVRGNINVTYNATQAAVCYTLKALLDPDAPNNQGMLDVPELIVPSGSLLNAAFPAPVAARANTCQRIIDVIIGALAPAIPSAVVGAANGANTTAVFAGIDPRTGRRYVYLETLGGGFGGRATKDGRDGVQVHITNTSNLPIEAIETEYPLFVESYGFVQDSGGAGQYRGGLGLRRVMGPVDHECTFNGAGERFTHSPWGLFDGEAGATGEFRLRDAHGREQVLPTKPSNISVSSGQTIIAQTPGAGAYGPPKHRSKELLREDYVSGKYSAEFLTRHYGFAPSEES